MRWVSPEEYGEFFLVYTIFGFLYIFRDVGLTSAIIKNNTLNEKLNSSGFWFCFLFAIILSSIIIISSNLIYEIILNTDLNNISSFLCIDLILGALGIIPLAILNHGLKFKELFYINLFSVLISSTIGIITAINGMGIYSLIFKTISHTFLITLFAFIYSSWRPKLFFSFDSIKQTTSFTIPLIANNLLNYWVRNIDDLLIGRNIGTSSLGFYNRSYQVMILPISNFTSVIGSVLFPSLCKIREKVQIVKGIYITSLRLISLLVTPIMMLLIFFTEEIIIVLFGNEWLPMNNTLKILALLSIFQSIASFVGILFLTYEKTNLLWRMNKFISVYIIIWIIFGVFNFRNIEGVASCYAFASLTALIPSFYISSKIINGNTLDFLSPLTIPFIISILSCTISMILTSEIYIISVIARLIINILLTILFYSIGIWIFGKSYLRDLSKIYKLALFSND